ncbi:unnamed protein product, partial [Scytosiphon promiscuus]
SASFAELVETGRAGPHAALISRDVPRAFGAVAPHKRRENGDGTTTPAKHKHNLGQPRTAATPSSRTPTPKSRPGSGSRRRMT